MQTYPLIHVRHVLIVVGEDKKPESSEPVRIQVHRDDESVDLLAELEDTLTRRQHFLQRVLHTREIFLT